MADEIKKEECNGENCAEAKATPETSEKENRKKARRAEAQTAELEKKLAEAAEELAAANDKYLRLYAEYDNFRKRSAKEREGIYGDAYADALCALLPIFDNLERAVKYSDGDSLQQGVALTLKGLTSTLEKLGITEIEAEGKEFDPNLHNAVMHVEDENAGENEIVEVFMKGYIRGDKVLRYSMVKVAN